jgi:hypothetical protein
MDIHNDYSNLILVNIDSIGPMLLEREARDVLRSEIDPAIESLNRRLTAGERIVRIESTVGIEGDGLTLLFFMEGAQK